MPLLGELGEPLRAEVDEPLVDPMINELAEPIVKADEQMVTLVIDMEKDLAMVIGDNDFSEDGLDDGGDDEDVWEMEKEWLMAPVTPPSMPVMPPPSTYEDLRTHMGNLEYSHGLLVKNVMTVSDAEVADGIAIGEIRLRVYAIEGQDQQVITQRDDVISELSQQVQTLQVAVQHRDVQIQQLQTLLAEMSSREGTFIKCIHGLDKCLADVERRYPGPQ
uniref:Uncharacterized protein n=1 Tax=Tanacetum cinerariifolium TaxID=118510 RepID=A0A699I5X4_TANCI|nr:hypothetical protein [Tanacetum cinerariifolium]